MSRRISFDAWVIHNYSCLLQIRGILFTGITQKCPDLAYIFDNPEFDEKLFEFLYTVSSGTVSSVKFYIPDQIESQLMDFFVNRNERRENTRDSAGTID